MQVSHRITTYRKLPPGETGWTQLGTRRVDTLQAIDWLRSVAPEGAITWGPQAGPLMTLHVRVDMLVDGAQADQ